MKAKTAFASFKNKASTYMNSIATKNANASYGRDMSKLVSAGSVASTAGPPGSNLVVRPDSKPSDEEILVVYPSYCRQREDGMFEVDVRGWLYLPGQPNRKSRMVLATAKKIAGVRSDPTSPPFSHTQTSEVPSQSDLISEDLITFSDGEDSTLEDGHTKPPAPPPPARRTTSSSTSTTQSVSQEAVLNARLAPFLTRAVPFRTVKITFGGLTDESGSTMKAFTTETNNSGRFSTRIELNHQPAIVSVEAHKNLVNFEEVINVEQEGISIISDIDDTVKNTGVLGNKRELFRNVFVRDYEKISIDGVQEWYQEMQQMGVKFHYVSNSPWQLYPTISEYLRTSKLPYGSMHLKEYSGFLTGLFEPAAEKKRMNLHKVMTDFPNRKFILIGDSGEGDLEAYIDLARRFPSQILAIYIRDVTLPPGDRTNLLHRPAARLPTSTGSAPSLLDLDIHPQPPPPPKSRASSFPVTQPQQQNPSVSARTSAKRPPPVPPKPINLMVNKNEENEAAPPTLPPRPSNNSRSNLDISGFAPPPPLPRGTLRPSSQASSRAVSPSPSHLSSVSNPVILPSSQDDYEFNDIIDRRAESWKARVLTARSELSEDVHLLTWRVGSDVRQSSIDMIRKAKAQEGSI